MKHIREMFEYMGYQVKSGENLTINDNWDVIWYHDYILTREPFTQMLANAKPQQIVNHVPGSGYYTSKVQLATCGLSKGVPIAFELPSQKQDLIEYAKNNPETLWVQKDNAHRNIRIRKIADMDLNKSDSFVQKFVENPLLIDNRFCPQDYHPLDVDNVDKYVVGDDYTPIWEIESLSEYVNKQKLSYKHTIDAYLGVKNIDSSRIWKQIQNIIAEVFQRQQSKMLIALSQTDLRSRYFELSRFDFVVDEDLNVFLMEANMSPNLSSGHFKQNQILYENALLSIFGVAGLAHHMTKDTQRAFLNRKNDENPLVTGRDINIPLKFCVEKKCEKCDEALECQLCGHCMSSGTREFLEQTYLEHLNRRQMRRVYFDYTINQPVTKEDHLLNIWLQTKCELDNSWC
ncbi:unnamed protein product [Caenorhabditis bovis]|uniref:Tubulin-tyrosine ligase family protein n=1 Tax=Caenorhabditis bovis TaxID=2654633 RepID=A0A8S1E9T2_9PELO|nr:unnamed protein product [Caenorhabditis bovis]